MAILPDHKILEAIYDKEIIINPFQRENIQPASIDLTLDDKIKVPVYTGETPLHIYNKEYDNHFSEQDFSEYILTPGSFVLARVKEYLRFSKQYNGHIQNRNSLTYAGVNIGISSFINPGYEGQLTIALNNFGTFPIVLTPGMRICQLVINRIIPEPLKGYSDRKDAKYHKEREIMHTKLYKDVEFKEFESRFGIAGKINNKKLTEFFEERTANKAINLDSVFTDEEKKEIGL